MTLFQPLWPTRPAPAALQRGWATRSRPRRALRAADGARAAFHRRDRGVLPRASRPITGCASVAGRRLSRKLYAGVPGRSRCGRVLRARASRDGARRTSSRANTPTAPAAILLRVYERNPDHPGAMHYLVHANDVPGREHELLDITRKYERRAAQSARAAHADAHLHASRRLGWRDPRQPARGRGGARAIPPASTASSCGTSFRTRSSTWSTRICSRAPTRPRPPAQAPARDGATRALVQDRVSPGVHACRVTRSNDMTGLTQHRSFRESPNQSSGADMRGPKRSWNLVRGLGMRTSAESMRRAKSATRIEELEAATRKSGEELFARNIQVLRLELNAWIAHAEGRTESSVALLTQAAELEASTPKAPVTPAPTIPADELLGDLFSEQARFADALASYQRSLVRYPERFNSLLGAARSARALDDRSTARKYYEHLLKIADVGTRRPVLDEARNYVRL